MHVFKKHLSRRTVLKGVGAAIALPLIDAMNPAATAWAVTPAGSAPKRLAFIGFPHGAIMDHWSPKETGTAYTMSPILEPLAPFRQHMTIVSGLRNKPGETPEPHAYIESTWWARAWRGARRRSRCRRKAIRARCSRSCSAWAIPMPSAPPFSRRKAASSIV